MIERWKMSIDCRKAKFRTESQREEELRRWEVEVLRARELGFEIKKFAKMEGKILHKQEGTPTAYHPPTTTRFSGTPKLENTQCRKFKPLFSINPEARLSS